MFATVALLAVLAADTGEVKAMTGPRHTTRSWTHDVGHVTTMALATPTVSLWLKELGVARRTARWVTLGTMVTAAVLKEVYDERVANGFSKRDLVYSGLGISIGMVITERIWR